MRVRALSRHGRRLLTVGTCSYFACRRRSGPIRSAPYSRQQEEGGCTWDLRKLRCPGDRPHSLAFDRQLRPLERPGAVAHNCLQVLRLQYRCPCHQDSGEQPRTKPARAVDCGYGRYSSPRGTGPRARRRRTGGERRRHVDAAVSGCAPPCAHDGCAERDPCRRRRFVRFGRFGAGDALRRAYANGVFVRSVGRCRDRHQRRLLRRIEPTHRDGDRRRPGVEYGLQVARLHRVRRGSIAGFQPARVRRSRRLDE